MTLEDRIAWLRHEARSWQAEGLVSEAQAQAIVARYPTTPGVPGAVDRSAPSRVRASGQIVVIISTVGAILLGLGVILFFASNWDRIPEPARVVLLFATTIATYVTGYALRFQPGRYPRVGDAIVFLGALFYGASIFLTAQIFHVNENAMDDLILLWLAGTLPLAYALRSPWTSGLNVILATVWLNFKVADSQTEFSFHAFAMMNVALGAAYYALGRAQAHWSWTRSHALPFRYLGVALAAGALYALTFDADSNAIEAAQGVSGVLVALAAGAAAALALYAHVLGSRAGAHSRLETATLLALCAYPLAFIIVPAVADDIAANLALAAFLLSVIVVGFRSADVTLVNLALVFVAIDIITRYFDFFYDLLPRSVFFMAGGALLLAGALFGERQRRKLVATMRAEGRA